MGRREGATGVEAALRRAWCALWHGAVRGLHVASVSFFGDRFDAPAAACRGCGRALRQTA